MNSLYSSFPWLYANEHFPAEKDLADCTPFLRLGDITMEINRVRNKGGFRKWKYYFIFSSKRYGKVCEYTITNKPTYSIIDGMIREFFDSEELDSKIAEKGDTPFYMIKKKYKRLTNMV